MSQNVSRRKFLQATGAVATGLGLAGCSSSSSDTDEGSAAGGGSSSISCCIASEPETVDPNLISSVDGSTYVQHMFEGLRKYVLGSDLAGDDENVKLLVTEEGMAESYDLSDDGLTYTFHLREANWSDGNPVVAGDFEYSWKRLVDPATASDYGYLLDGIVLNAADIQAGEKDASELGIEATDDSTLVVTLESECPYFEGLCAFPSLYPVPQHVVEENENWASDPETLVTNGAYVMSSWTHDSVISMTKSDSYYNADAVTMDNINWYLMDSETTYLASYQSGELNFVESLSGENITTMQASGDCFIVDSISSYYLYLQCERITDWRVRAAITLAIDRQNIIDTITMGGQTPSTGIVAKGITAYDDSDWQEYTGEPLYDWLASEYGVDLSTYAARTELAQQLLDEAVADGYNTSTTLDYEYNTSDAHKAIAEAVQSDLLSVLGLNVTLNNSEWQTYTTNLGEGKFDLARLGWSADYDDPSTYLELFTNDASYNYGRWTSDEYTALVAECKTLPDGADRDAKMKEAEALLYSENGFTACPIYNYTQNYCLSSGYSNVGWTPLGYFIFTYATQA